MSFIAKRAIQLLLVVLAVTALTFMSLLLLPGNPAIVICGTAGQQCIDEQTDRLHLNDHGPVRYLRWLAGVTTGDLGKSANTNQEVRAALGERAPVTLALVVYSQLLALGVAIPVGLLAAQKVGTGFDRSSTGCAFGLLAVPAFIAAPPLVALFAVKLKWFNATGYQGLELWTLLLQIIFFAAAIPGVIALSQWIGPGLGRSPAATRALVVGEALLAIVLLAFLAYSATSALSRPVIGAIIGLGVGAGVIALAIPGLLRQEYDDAGGPASVAALVAMLYMFILAVIALKIALPLAENPDSPARKLVNQGLFDFKGLFLPSFVLAIAEMATYMRLLRSDLISTLQEDYITMAKAKGLSPRAVMMKHALRPSTFSLITVAGLNFGRLIGGTLIVEIFFALPGIGKYLVESVLRRDYLAVMGAVLLITVSYVAVTFVLDAVYAVLDPRIRHARVVV